MSAFNYKR